MAGQFDAVVLGAGPGGYVAAIRLGQLGKKTLLVDKDKLGGACLNYGCIPSKALIHSARLVRKLKESKEIGIEASDLKVDFEKTQAWKKRVVQRLRGGVELLCKGNGVEIVNGEARIKQGRIVEVKTATATEEFQAGSIVVATGSSPIELRNFRYDGRFVLDSTGLLELSGVPNRLLIIGGGAIGLELGGMYMDLGSKLTVVELMPQLLPGFDPEVVDVVHKAYAKRGAKIHLNSQAQGYEVSDQGVRVTFESEGKDLVEEFDRVLVSVGRRPNTTGLGLEETGVRVDQRGYVVVDEKMRTTSEGIYAIGDVVGPPFLAHKASHQGVVAAEVIAGLPAAFDNRALAGAVFTDPEVGTVGLTEEEARKTVGGCVAEQFPFQASGRALTERESLGFVKIVADSQRKHILGVHIVGPHASDLISEAALAIETGAVVEDLARTIHPHPTLPEALMEAAEAIIGSPIHMLKREQ